MATLRKTPVPSLRQKPSPTFRTQGPALPKFPGRPATPASIVDALKAATGDPPGERASFAKGQCVRGTYLPSDRAEEITKSLSFTRPSRVLARFALGGGGPDVAGADKF